jgi:hypothetical protein
MGSFWAGNNCPKFNQGSSNGAIVLVSHLSDWNANLCHAFPYGADGAIIL